MNYEGLINFSEYIDVDIKRKNVLMDKQKKYNHFLEKSFYNRKVKDFRTGEYKEAGRKIMYFLNSSTGVKKNIMGYNFNHTICPCYLNYNNKLNIEKVKNIIEVYQDEYASNKSEVLFTTCTMPNLVATPDNVEYINDTIRSANQILTNLFKQLKIKFGMTGQIKKYETTYSYSNGKPMIHPHFHLLMHFENTNNVKLLKGDESARKFIFEYWYNHFLCKYLSKEISISAQKSLELNFSSNGEKGINISKLSIITQAELDMQLAHNGEYSLILLSDYAKKEVTKKVCLGAFDIKRAKYANLKHEIAGYIGASAFDYLVSQEVFDFAYQHMYNKRVLTYQGIFKEINKLLKLDEIEDLEELKEDTTEYDLVVSSYYSKRHASYYINKISVRKDDSDEFDVIEFNQKKKNTDLNERMRSSGLDKSTSSGKKEKLMLLENYFRNNLPTWEMLENNQVELQKLEDYKNQGYIEQLHIALD